MPTAGTAPSVGAENVAAGSRAWREGDRDTRADGIDVYVSDQDPRPGATERVYVRSRAPRVRIRLFRIGWYGGSGGRLMATSGPLPVARQPSCTHISESGLTECDWHPTLRFALPTSLPSGVYVVNVLAGSRRQRDAIFVLRSAAPSRLVVHIPTATWEAYNDWGGDSLYPGGRRVGATATTQGVEVSFDRPYSTTTGAGQFFFREAAMVRFLERYGYPVAYVGSGDDPALAGTRGAIDIGHSEYWSARERAAFAAALGSGTSLAFFSSDTLAWRVAYEPAGPASSEAGAEGHRIAAGKEFARAGAFPDGGASLTGSAYVGCITPRATSVPRASYRYYDWAPNPAHAPAWLFAGTGLSPATPIAGMLGYELDERIDASPAGTVVVGGGSAPCSLARSAGPPAPLGSVNRADTTLYATRAGAFVFATGTLGWGFAVAPLADPSADVRRAPSPGLVRMTRNVVDRMLAR